MNRKTNRILKATAGLLVLVLGAGVVMTAQTAQAEEPGIEEGLEQLAADLAKAQSVIGYAMTAYSLLQRLNGEPSELERATTEIIDAVHAAKTELLDHIDDNDAAKVNGCKDSALTDVENLAHMTDAQLDGYANRAIDCVNQAKNLIDSIASPRAINEVSLAMNTVAPLALIAKTRLGHSTRFLTANIRAGNGDTIRRLQPKCVLWTDEESGQALYHNVLCTSFNGTKKARTVVAAYGPIKDYTAEIDFVMRSTSYELSKTLLTMM
jgi:hypothetical protein